ncbi:preprotein translocase subunit SecE [Ruminiclostridium cellobioparum]|jgi:preprotein translocase subunit SecE|uniref:Protein translocase subunit SecE n=1 Tax=Ruminiclostridium cellobioparum subsp. termitidis CT1112 TaxID=1195236 RepID=S0FZT4_RUMCE|nr:preprotein translocase, SecE subunit, bacterial [Ruminiclostridium cellobioparum subsp. termitidis CT1112]
MMAENEVKKVSRIKRTGQGMARLFREIRAELKKVIWPNRTQLINNTITVLIFCLVVGVIIWAADFGLTALADVVFTK